MLQRCTGLTRSGSKCKRSLNCNWHQSKPKDTCSVCMEDIITPYTTTCNHPFHESCISNWYKESDVCPICRCVQHGDKYVLFKRDIEQASSDRYADAIRTLEIEIQRLRRRRVN